MRRVQRKRSTGARWLWSGLALVSAILVGFYLSLPYLIQHLLPRWLHSQGVALHLESVEQDILGARLLLRGVRALREEPLLSAEECVLGLDLSGLFSADLRLDKVECLRGEVAVERDKGRWHIAGLPLDQSRAAWARYLVRLDFADFIVRSQLPGLNGLRLEQGQVQRGSLAAGGPLSLRLDGALDEGMVRFTGEAWPTADAATLAGEITLRNLAVERVLSQLTGSDMAFETATADGQVRVDVHGGGGQQAVQVELDGRLRLRELKAKMSRSPVLARGLVWVGEGRLALQAGRISRASFQGRAEVEQWQQPVGGPNGIGTPLLLEDAVWEGRLEWSPATTMPAGITQVGDMELGRVVIGYGPDYAFSLERVSLWGVEQRGGSSLQVGRMQARRVAGGTPSGGKPGLSTRLITQKWRAAELETGLLELKEGPLLRQRFIEVADVELMATAFRRSGHLGRARVEGLRYSDNRLHAGTLALHDLVLTGDGSFEEAEALVLEQALFLEISLRPSESLSVGESRLSGLRANLTTDAQGRWLLPGFGPATRAGFELPTILGTLQLGGASRIEVVDRTRSPPYRLALDEIQARLASWDSHRSIDGGRFSLDARLAKTGRLALAGRIGPLKGPMRVALHGEALDIPLDQLPSVLREPLTPGIEAGIVGAWFDLKAADEAWTAYAELRLRGLDQAATRASAFDNGRLLLQDERGELRLELELHSEGEPWADPSLLSAATEQGLTGSIVDHYGSLGVTTVNAQDALRTGRLPLAPLAFRPGSSSFDRVAASHLEAVVDRLKHRPLTRLRVCAQSVSADVQRPAVDGRPPIDPAVLANQGRALADLRDRHVRDHLVRNLGLAAKRVLPCEPVFQAASAQGPGVDLEIEVGR